MARSTVILSVIAAGMLAFILLHERNLLSSGELEARKNRVLTSFVRDRISRVEVVRQGDDVILERKPDPEIEGQFGPWREIEPMDVAADQESVDVLLGELEWLQPRRMIEDINDEDRQRFGLDKPRIEIRYSLGKQRGILRVGKEEPTGLGLYASTDDPSVAYIVGKDLFESLDHDGGHYHTRELHAGVFVFSASAVVTRDEAGEQRAEYRDGAWWMVTPRMVRLAIGDVDAWVKAFDTLRAKRFVASKLGGPDTYGLDKPAFVLTVERKRSSNATTSTPVTLRVGATCGEHADERFVQVNGGPVMCANGEELKSLMRPVSAFEDKSPLPIDPERAQAIGFEGPAGTIALKRTEERWALRASKGEAVDADRTAVVEWMNAMRALRSDVRLPAQDIAGAKPLATLRLQAGAETPAIVVELRVASDGALLAQRSGEDGWLRYEPTAVETARPFAARFRSLSLVDEADAPLQRLSVTKAGVTETIERAADGWKLTAPLTGAADPVLMAEVAHLLAQLSAVRFVADAPDATHGLAAGAMRVAFRLGATERVLVLGAATEGGVFAALERDPAVFVVPTRVPETVGQGLLARTALATTTDDVQEVTITRADGRRLHIVKQDGRLAVAEPNGTDIAPLAIVDRLARLRFSTLLHYGAVLPADGLAKPRLTITVRTGSGEHALSFGDATPEQATVRRSDLDATLGLPPSAVESFATVFP